MQLLAMADTDDKAFDELLRYRAPQWLAAYGFADADCGSMGAQSNRGAGGDSGRGVRVRRGIPNVLAAMHSRRKQAVGLLRELANAMSEGHAPRPVASFGVIDTAGPLADRSWFDGAFPKGTSRLPQPPRTASTSASGPESDGDAQEPLFYAAPAPC